MNNLNVIATLFTSCFNSPEPNALNVNLKYVMSVMFTVLNFNISETSWPIPIKLYYLSHHRDYGKDVLRFQAAWIETPVIVVTDGSHGLKFEKCCDHSSDSILIGYSSFSQVTQINSLKISDECDFDLIRLFTLELHALERQNVFP